MHYVVEDIKNEDKGSPAFVKNAFYAPNKQKLADALDRMRGIKHDKEGDAT